MKNHLSVGYFKTSLMIAMLAAASVAVLTGQSLAADCTTCHTMPPTDAVSPSFRNVTTGAFKGNHQTHAAAAVADCNKCHNNSGNPATYLNGHAATNNYVIQMSTNINNSPSTGTYGKGAFFNQTSIPNLTNATCSNVNCHFGGAGYANATPTWGSPKFAYTNATTNDCNKCHSSAGNGSGAAVGTLFGGSHAKHTSTTTLDVTNCNKCHPAYTTFQHATSAGQRAINVTFAAGGSYSGGNMTNPPTLPPTRTFGTCSATYCHGTAATPPWGGTLSSACEACHMSSTGTGALPAGHTIHIAATVAAPGSGSYTNAASDNSTTTAYNFSCASCHGNNINNHANGAVNTNGAAGIQFLYSSAGKNQTNYSYGASALTDSKGFKYSNGGGATGCNTTYCHSNGQSGTGSASGTSITWTTAAAGNCNVCHGNEANATALSGVHSKHIGNAGTGGSFTCSDCHAKTITSTDNRTLANKANHVNKFIDYSGVNAGKAKVAYGSHVSCSNVYCHSNGNRSAIAFVSMTGSKAWTGSANFGCNSCHGRTTDGKGTPNSGIHQKHMSTTSANGMSCANCHYGTTTTGTTITTVSNHINGTSSPSPSNVAWGTSTISVNFTYNVSTGCSNITCHNSNAAAWNGTPAATGCLTCHPSLSGAHAAHIGDLLTAGTASFYNYTANKSTGSEVTATGAYRFGCANCHPTTTAANHMDGSVEISVAQDATGASGSLKKLNPTSPVPTYNSTGKTCQNIYCHSNGYATTAAYATSPAWTTTYAAVGGDKCGKCHDNAPGRTGGITGSSAHDAHSVGIHYDDIYNGTSGKLPQAGSQAVNAGHGAPNRSTTLSCNICHNNTINVAYNDLNPRCSDSTNGCHGNGAPTKGNAKITDRSFHLNGAVNVTFAATTISSKAQLRDSSFANLTAANNGGWARNRGYKNYTSSYDKTKLNLNAAPLYTNTAAGCTVSCHSGVNVKWTDTVTCQSCHTAL